MTDEEQQKDKDLISRIVALNEGHQELVRQSVVFGTQLTEQSKRISDLYMKIDARLNNSLIKE